METTQERAHRIGEQIRAARKRRGMSQAQLAAALAERVGIEPEAARRTLVNNETGKYAPHGRRLEMIAEITEFPLSFFVGSPEVDADQGPFRNGKGR